MAAESIQLTNSSSPKQKYRDFDDVLEEVGSVGKYQRIFLYGVLFPISVFEGLLGWNVWFLMDEPDHWCNVPGREEKGLDLFAWKNLTIPREESGHFSKCKMFDENHTQVACTSGWEYDFSVANYHSILTDYDWVCDKSHYPTWVFTAGSIGSTLGTLILGILADKIGRKPVFIITVMLFTIGRGVSLFFATNIYAFAAISLITGMASPMFAISCSIIAVELSGKEYRAWIYSFTWMILVVGNAMLPLIALVSPNWMVFGPTTLLIASITYFFLPWMPESPRWLLSQGKVKEVVTILKKISEYNGTTHKFKEEEITEALKEVVKSSRTDDDEAPSVLEIFARKRLVKYTLLIIFTWVMNGLLFNIVGLNALNLGGNRYLNFFLVNLMEAPGSFFGGQLSNKFGRRWMQVFFFAVVVISSVIAAFFSGVAPGSSPEDEVSSTIFVVTASNVAKFACTMSFLVIYLQALEVFPTPFRTTGNAWASTTSGIANIMVPYIVFTGKANKSMPWIICAAISLAGMTSASFIPETMNQKLPETLDEANAFGRGMKFWSFKVPRDLHKKEND